MKFSINQVERFQEAIEKLQRYYGYKYNVMRKEVGIIIKGAAIHILISGKLKEGLTVDTLHSLEIDEAAGTIK